MELMKYKLKQVKKLDHILFDLVVWRVVGLVAKAKLGQPALNVKCSTAFVRRP